MSVVRSMRLTRLSFTGKDLETVSVDFHRDLTLIYGASNAGKSLILKSVDYMFGGYNTYPHVKQSKDYEDGFLSFTLEPGATAVTLRRSLKGGAIDWYEGASNETEVGSAPKTTLGAEHGKPKGGSLSERLLHELGVPDSKIATNKAGALQSFSFRNFMPFVLMSEARMFGEEGPLKQWRRSSPGEDKNVFRFLLTGKDDAGIARVHTPKEASAAKAGKIEVLETMLASAEAEVARYSAPDPADADVEDRLDLASEEVATRQTTLDGLVAERRAVLDRRDTRRAEISEIETSLLRYADLERVFHSDIRRLQAIEEGGFLLRRFDDQPCPLCGAAPGDQHRQHEPGDLEREHAAALKEIGKIERDAGDLRELIASMNAELESLRARVTRLDGDIDELELRIATVRPQEASLREQFRQLTQRASTVRRRGEALARRDALARQLEEVRKAKTKSSRTDGTSLGITSNIAHEISQVVKDVLIEWGYPEIEAVRWDPDVDDIEINGWPRSGNGKGVKAIFHSALKIAVLIHCRKTNPPLPHPGFLILDSPLVTYREPILNEKHGELADDELAVRATTLDQRFYGHLDKLKDLAQFIVLENNDPPSGVLANAKIERFSGATGAGRRGLFPPAM